MTETEWTIELGRHFLGWRWEVYHSGYGAAGGFMFTKRGAYAASSDAILDFLLAHRTKGENG